jgi:AraC family transcriptional regulator
VWGCSDGIRSVRELRMSFPPNVLGSILGDELDFAKTDRPVLMLYDDKVVRCAALGAEECQEPSSRGRLYGESLTTTLTVALFSSRQAHTHRTNGFSRWQLRQAMHYRSAHAGRHKPRRERGGAFSPKDSRGLTPRVRSTLPAHY